MLTNPMLKVEMCMGMGTIGIPRVPWDSHWNETDVECVMGMGMRTAIKALEWKQETHQEMR